MLKALIVEDELLARTGLRTLVNWNKLGYELLRDAKDGHTALEIIREARPHLVFLDINIPGINGLELMKQINQEDIPVKIVVLSAFEDYETVRAALKLGAVDYISKLSLNKEEFSALLQNLRIEEQAGHSGTRGTDPHQGIPGRRDDNEDESRHMNYAALLRFYGEKPESHIPGTFTEKTAADIPLLPLFRNLENSLEKMEYESVEKAVCAMFELVRGTKYLPEHVVRRMLADMLAVFSLRAARLGASIDTLFVNNSSRHYQFLMSAEDLSALESGFLLFAKSYTEAFFPAARAHNSLILTRALEYIANNIFNPIQLSETARFAYVSESHLSNLFRQKLGVNFVTFVVQQKMKKAKELLLEGDFVYQAAEKLGYESASYFSKVFKKYEGLSPEHFLQANRDG